MNGLQRYLISLVVVTNTAVALHAADESQGTQFVVCKEDKLFVGENEFRFISFNIPNLHLVEDNFAFTKPNPWRWPNEFEIADALESVRQMGGTVVRIYVLSVRRDGSDMGDHVFVQGPGEFNEQAYRVLDRVLAIAREKGIRVIIPLVDNWHWWGGRAEYAKFRGKEPDDFWTDNQIIADFEATIRHTLNRKNTVHGIAYKDDPTIFGWETGNELDSTPQWTRRIAALLKSLDPQHLVIDGFALHGVRQESLDDPNIDVITTHHYPNTDQDYVAAILKARQKTSGIKPYFVGEFGFVPTKDVERVLNTVIEHDVSGALLWSLRFHSRDGGFYWHWETGSNGLYKAYHWPGFDSGAAYDERQMLRLMREKAFSIRAMPVPERHPPATPKLLAIADIGAISWQGSPGAESYDVERSTNPQGPWEVVGENVSDAHVQYRPLFNDQTATVGQAVFYRVKARNSAGDSPASNVFGPVLPRWKVLVDECRNLERVESSQGDVVFVGDNERKTQEDSHRLRLSPGSSITYQVDKPINNFLIYAFSDKDEVGVRVESSGDGQEFSACEVQRQSISVGNSDYGYRRPLLLRGSIDTDAAMHLRISLPKENTANKDRSSVELSRVEIRFGGQQEDQANEASADLSRGASLNPSILLFHKPYQKDGVQPVRRAAELQNRCVNVVVTMLCEIDEDRQVVGYGVLRRGKFKPLDEQLLAEFRETLRKTFAEAVAHDMDIAIVAHLNSWGKVGDWRNYFRFDPLVKYRDYNYQQAVIESIIEALVAAEAPRDRVELSLAGEMGRSVFTHAHSYHELMRDLRNNDITTQIDLGISMNFNRVSGEYQPNTEQQERVQELINDCDFVGFSNYRWFDLPPDAGDFSNAVQEFLKEMKVHGVTIPEEMPLQFSEVGIGGCTEDGQLTDSPAVAAKTPWEGSDQLSRNPWISSEMCAFRREFHAALLDFLKHQPNTHRVAKAFLWSEGSWDPMDIAEAGFGNSEIISLIQQHNEELADRAP